MRRTLRSSGRPSPWPFSGGLPGFHPPFPTGKTPTTQAKGTGHPGPHAGPHSPPPTGSARMRRRPWVRLAAWEPLLGPGPSEAFITLPWSRGPGTPSWLLACAAWAHGPVHGLPLSREQVRHTPSQACDCPSCWPGARGGRAAPGHLPPGGADTSVPHQPGGAGNLGVQSSKS